jgi:F-box/leucine-rich repeat protein 2/20
VPYLEFLELASIGAELRDDGLVRLLNTTPFIRKLDLEDASEITDTVIVAITPGSVADTRHSSLYDSPEPGHALEHLVVSYAINVSDEVFLSLIQNCPRLSVLEADNTRISGTVLKEFVRLARSRKMVDPVAVVIDCRGIGESLVKELSGSTRPRKGWRSYEARKLGYVDGRDKEDLKVGRDECDEKRVVLKSFYSWQTVDAARAAREKRRKTKRAANVSGGSTSDSDDLFSARARWWSPNGRRSSGNISPTVLDANGDRDQCRIM